MLGTFYLPNGDVWHCAEADRDYYFNRAKETLADGVPLPVCLEHQPSIGMSAHKRLEEQTARTVGHCHDVRIAAPEIVPDGEGQIQWLVDCDDADFEILRKNKCFSPEIRQNVINTLTGKRYPGGSVVHLASTPRPVQVTGKPHISLSQSVPVSLSKATVTVSLSGAVLLSAKGKDMADMALSTDTTGHEHADKGQTGGGQFVASSKSAAAASKRTVVQRADHHDATMAAHKLTNKANKSNKPDDHIAASHAHYQAHESHRDQGDKWKGRTTDVTDQMVKNHREASEHHRAAAFSHYQASGGSGGYEEMKKSHAGRKLSVTEVDDMDDDDDDGIDDDLEGGGPVTDPPAVPATPVTPPAAGGGIGADAHLISALSEIVKDLGIEVHASPGTTLQSYVEHLCTAFKTHKATKDGGADDENLNQQDPNQEQIYQGQEVAESPPIQMSTTTKATDRELKMAKALVKSSIAGIKNRINVAHQRGFINDAMVKSWTEEVSTVKLSMADFTDDGDLRPLAVSIKLDAIEEQMKSAKVGPFAKGTNGKAPAKGPDPLKPISTAVQLSVASDEVAVDPPYGGDDDDDEKANRAVQEKVGDELAARV